MLGHMRMMTWARVVWCTGTAADGVKGVGVAALCVVCGLLDGPCLGLGDGLCAVRALG